LLKCPASSISAILRIRTSLIIYKNYIEMREGMGQMGQQILTASDKVWRIGQGAKI